MNNKLLEEILEVKQLPSLPAVAVQVLSLVRKKDTSFASIAKAISSDPALSAKVLKTVNSSFYGVAQPVRTINHALVLLGMQTIKTIALGFSLVRGLSSKTSERFDYIRFWRQSLFTAVAARALAKLTACADYEEAFLAGLLSDLGTLAMHRAIGQPYDDLLLLCQGDQTELVRLSRQRFDLDHAEVGAALAERWKFPESLVEPIRRHHTLGNISAKPGLVEATHAAVLCAQTFSAKRTGLLITARKVLEAVFGLTSAKTQELLKLVDVQTKEMADLFEVKIKPGRSYQDIEEEARQTLIELSLEAQMEAQKAMSRNKVLIVQANTDGLTGLSNRRHFADYLAIAFTQATQNHTPLSMVLLDFDHFKAINDTQGHQAGDAVLENVGRRIKAMIGPNDLAARYGGEEIAIILKNMSPLEALDLAEQMRKAIATNPVPFDAGTIKITASFGVATMDSANIFDSFDELIGAADRGLYAAKEAGRNCCRSVSNVLNQTCVNGVAQTQIQTPAAA